MCRYQLELYLATPARGGPGITFSKTTKLWSHLLDMFNQQALGIEKLMVSEGARVPF